MSSRVRTLLAAAGCAAGLLVGTAGPAAAHPLGNFSVNRYTGIVVSPGTVTVDSVLDVAEVPSAQRMPAIDTSGDGRLSSAELATWARSACADTAGATRLTVAGAGQRLAVGSSLARGLTGQGGLPVLRLECRLRADIGQLQRPTEIRLVTASVPGEVGWREVTARGDRATLTRSDVPARGLSGRLTTYPRALLSSPPDVTAAVLRARPGGPALAAAAAGPAGSPSAAPVRGADRLSAWFEGLVRRSEAGPLVALAALLAAVAVGAAHAVAPGHGKTMMAFYLSGAGAGAARSAATVGAAVTVTHTAAVLVLGVLVSAGTAVAPAVVLPWLTALSGLLVVTVGVTLLRDALPGRTSHTGSHPHSHAHPHSHPHPHSDPNPHPHPQPVRTERAALAVMDRDRPREHPVHSHEATDEHSPSAPPGPAGLLAMGLAGGLVPSPSALLVFLAALGLGHPWFGVALVLAFGVGMAGTLAATGLVVSRLRARAESRLRSAPRSRLRPLLDATPVLAATGVLVLGVLLTLRGLGGPGPL